ncbi:MAG: hypothetical protein P4L53_29390, partial [Candidatus Obscuribacterales bacterium]|nr:hypothetical protein [Candidatus Obscuribacterales bacterium]
MPTLQVDQPVPFEPRVKCFPFAKGLAPPLTPIPQETAESTLHKMVHIPERLARIAVTEVVAPTSKDEVD